MMHNKNDPITFIFLFSLFVILYSWNIFIFYRKLKKIRQLKNKWNSLPCYLLCQKKRPNTNRKEEKIGLLLAGPLGGGKSATGNSILLSNIFIPQTNQKSPTKKKHAQVGYKVLYNQGITVVDGIDLTFFHENESFECAFFLAEKCIEKYGNGFNALLYVVSYTGTFLYDSKYFSVLENILGEDFVTNKSILIVTYGDCFISSNTENISFDNWCSAQEDPFKKLFLKCGGRAVLFDNNTQDKKRKEKQIKELLHIVNDMNDGKKYYKKDFNLDKSGVCNNTTKLLSEK